MVESDPAVPGSNSYAPQSKIIHLSFRDDQLAYALGTLTHEMSHARDYLALWHGYSQNRPTTVSQQARAADFLFTTELKAWVLEAMQCYLSEKAGLMLTPNQGLLIEGFQAGVNDVINSSFNYVGSRIIRYLERTPECGHKTAGALLESNQNLKTALTKACLLFHSFVSHVESGFEINAEKYLGKLDDIFHHEFYPPQAAKSEKGRIDLDLEILMGILEK